MNINSYLEFNGQCEAAFKFYQSCLGGELTLLTHEGAPMAEHAPPEWAKKILHASLKIGDAAFFGSDAPPEYFKTPQGFSVSISIKDPAEADRIFQALSENGNIRMPIQETFWAVRFGMLVDQFGIPWMINCEKAA